MLIWVLLCLWSLPGDAPDASSPRSPRQEAVAAFDAGDVARSAALLDSLLADDPTDADAAYWRARAAEAQGNGPEARCRYLALEAGAPGTPAALLAAGRRRSLERREADALVVRFARDDRDDRDGPDGRDGPGGRDGGQAEAEEGPGTAVLLLPPEALGSAGESPLFGLAWAYLLADGLAGPDLCPISVPSLLAATDLLRAGRAVRAPQSVSAWPVNTVEGLRARLAALPGVDGLPYLATAGREWDAALEQAIRRFQTDQEIPPTGDADLGTQARLEDALESWLGVPPPPLEPKLLPSAARLLGADVVVRGTYRREGGQLEVSLALLDAGGTPRHGEPIVRRFRPADLPQAAREAARAIADRLGATRPPAAASWSMAPEEFDRAAASLLLHDRGMPAAAQRRWLRAPEIWFDWPGLRSAREAADLSADRAAQIEAALRRRWTGPVGLDPDTALEAFSDQLGLPARGSGARPELNRFGVLGNDGLLHVHGEAP